MPANVPPRAGPQLGQSKNGVPLTAGIQRPVTGSALNRGTTPPIVPYAGWQAACDRVVAALLARRKRVLIVGPPGTGKTLLLENTARILRAAGWTVILRQADASPFHGAAKPAIRGKVALLIDEADRIPRDALTALLAVTKEPVVLAGLEVLAKRLPKLKPIVLPALKRKAARDFVAQWLALAAHPPASLETAAVWRLVELSSGAPRLLSTLLGASFWLAQSGGESIVTAVHVDEAASLRSSLAELDPPFQVETVPQPRRRLPRLASSLARSLARSLAPTLAAAVVLGLGAFTAAHYGRGEIGRVIAAAGGQLGRLQSAVHARVAQTIGSHWPPASATAASMPPTPERPPATPPGLEIARQAPQPVLEAVTPTPDAMVQPSAPPEPSATAALPDQPSAQEATAEHAPEPAIETEPAITPATASISAPDINPEIPPGPDRASAVADAAPAAATAPAGAAVAAAANGLSDATIGLLLRRGREMVIVGDISAARLLFGRAAEAGNVEAMLDLGRTYDPIVLSRGNLLVDADAGTAARWYRRAALIGSREASVLLGQLEPDLP